jgi:hypothetical protein
LLKSLLQALETEPIDFKRKILLMVEDNKFGEVCGLLLAMQRATVRDITSIAFNPFYVEGGELKTPRGLAP